MLNIYYITDEYKRLKQIQQSPELGLPLGNKNNMNLSGFRKAYVAKRKLE